MLHHYFSGEYSYLPPLAAAWPQPPSRVQDCCHAYPSEFHHRAMKGQCYIFTLRGVIKLLMAEDNERRTRSTM